MVIAARREDKLQEVADEIKSAGGEAAIVVGDISKVESWLVWQATCIICSGRVNFLFMDASLCACFEDKRFVCTLVFCYREENVRHQKVCSDRRVKDMQAREQDRPPVSGGNICREVRTLRMSPMRGQRGQTDRTGFDAYVLDGVLDLAYSRRLGRQKITLRIFVD